MYVRAAPFCESRNVLEENVRRSVAVLMAAVFLTAIVVITLRHQSRGLATQFETLQAERDTLNVEWGKLLLEEGAWSEHRRVENLARTRLGMAIPDSRHIVVLDLREGKNE